jgi:hypothetical protein
MREKYTEWQLYIGDINCKPEFTGKKESQSEFAVGLTCVYDYREEAVQYGSGDIAEGLNDSTLNDSQANTTVEGEITQDSVQMLVYYC